MSEQGCDEVQSYVQSQAHLLNKSEYNPLPTELPPPIAALSALGDMHVVVLIGLPEVGKPFLAKRMRQYLRFFHGADCALFDICEDQDYPNVELSSKALSKRIAEWMLRKGGPQEITAGSPLLDGEGKAATPAYKGQKAVDSGRCAIVYGSNSFKAFEEKWSGSSKERRRWIQDEVKQMSRSVKLVLVEVKVTDPVLMRKNVTIKRQAMGLPSCEDDFRKSEAMVKEYAKLYGAARVAHVALEGRPWPCAPPHSPVPRAARRARARACRYVTLQQDGSEEDMSYVIFINYGQKVVTNRMHGFLRMRIAQFLATCARAPAAGAARPRSAQAAAESCPRSAPRRAPRPARASSDAAPPPAGPVRPSRPSRPPAASTRSRTRSTSRGTGSRSTTSSARSAATRASPSSARSTRASSRSTPRRRSAARTAPRSTRRGSGRRRCAAPTRRRSTSRTPRSSSTTGTSGCRCRTASTATSTRSLRASTRGSLMKRSHAGTRTRPSCARSIRSGTDTHVRAARALVLLLACRRAALPGRPPPRLSRTMPLV